MLHSWNTWAIIYQWFFNFHDCNFHEETAKIAMYILLFQNQFAWANLEVRNTLTFPSHTVKCIWMPNLLICLFSCIWNDSRYKPKIMYQPSHLLEMETKWLVSISLATTDKFSSRIRGPLKHMWSSFQPKLLTAVKVLNTFLM